MAALRELFILNNAEQRLVVFDDLPVADANLGNLAVHFAVDLVHQLHGLNDAERVTRRNMKQCVTEYIQTHCYEDMDFARQVMHPRKTMIRCFRYITRKAKEFVKQEMEDNDEKPTADGYGCDVPDDLCYQWAVQYFMDMEAPEDKTDEDKEFVPKPYTGKSASKPKKKPEKKKTEPKKEEQKEQTAKDATEQMTLFEVSA